MAGTGQMGNGHAHTQLLQLQGIRMAGAVARVVTTWCRVKDRGFRIAHRGDMMTGSLGANAVWSFEGVEPAVNIEETCQQVVETQTVIRVRIPEDY